MKKRWSYPVFTKSPDINIFSNERDYRQKRMYMKGWEFVRLIHAGSSNPGLCSFREGHFSHDISSHSTAKLVAWTTIYGLNDHINSCICNYSAWQLKHQNGRILNYMDILTKFNNGEYMISEGFIGKYIAFLYRDCQKYLDRELEPYNIGSSQAYILMSLFEADGINQESISRIIKVDKTSITRSIQKLIEEGYVVRQKDEEDNRSYRVFLTGKARQIEPDIWKIASGWEDILLSGFDTDQRSIIVDSLKDMSDNVSRKMED